MKVVQSCPTLCNPMNYTVHEILQARILQWVAFPSSRGSSQPKDQTQVSSVASGFFTSWATREVQEYCNHQPIPSPVDLSNPGIELGSAALQADSLPTELWGKPKMLKNPPAIAGDSGSIPGSERSPGEGNGYPTPVFLPGEFYG